MLVRYKNKNTTSAVVQFGLIDLISVSIVASLIMLVTSISSAAKHLNNTPSLVKNSLDVFEPTRELKRNASIENLTVDPGITGHKKTNLDRHWWEKAKVSIQQHRYRFVLQNNEFNNSQGKSWIGNNRVQRMSTSFSSAGVIVRPSSSGKQVKHPWQINIQFISANAIGNSEVVSQFSKIEPKVSLNKLEYIRGETTEWYINTPQGIEQGFTISKPLSTNEQPIEIKMGVYGYQRAEYGVDGSIEFSVAGKDKALVYGLPHAFDADHKPLAATMSLSDNQISLIVQTQDAAYPITIDPLIGTTTDNCNNPYLWCDGAGFESSDYGWTVINAGDVNGDGFDDILITDPFYNFSSTTLSQQGEAYLFYGSASGLSHTIAWNQLGRVASSSFGLAAASGDINGDGFSDVIIGAPGDLSLVDAAYLGQVFVYYGSLTGLSTTANWTATSNAPLERFGDAVAAADVNGDGLHDVIVGAPGHTTVDTLQNSFPDAGAVYAYYATAIGLPATADWLVEAYQSDALLGDAVAKAGNVNGDVNSINGVDHPVEDVIIGAYHFDTLDALDVLHPNAGRVVVYYGAAGVGLPQNVANGDFSVAPDWMQESFKDYMFFGAAVATAGNVNGDTTVSGVVLDDVVIGAHAFRNAVGSPSPPYPGTSYVYHGSSTGLDAFSSWTASGSNYGLFGYAVSSAGDINDDGFDEVITGEPYYSLAGSVLGEEGRAILYSSTSNGLAPDGPLIGMGVVHGDFFGWSAANADVNNDGYSDIIIGAPGLRSYAADTNLALGGVYVFEGAGDSDLSVSTTLVNSNSVTKTAQFSVTITNNGPDVAHKIQFTDTLSGTTSYVSTAPLQWNCAINELGSQLFCPAPTDTSTNLSLVSGESVSLIIELKNTSLSAISHTAEVSAHVIDPNLTNNSVTSAAINSPPQGINLFLTVTEDITLSDFSFNVADPDPNAVISYVINTPPTNGTVTIKKEPLSGNHTGRFDYKPVQNNNLPDKFIFEAFDEKGASSGPLTVSIEMIPVNDAPTATTGLNFSVDVGKELINFVSGTDVEQPAVLSYAIQTAAPLPPGGTLSMTNPNTGEFSFQAIGATAGDIYQFSFLVTDGDPNNPLSDSASVSVTITDPIQTVNLPPVVAANQQLDVLEDVTTAGVFVASDTTPATPVLTYSLDPAMLSGKGTVIITDPLTGTFSYRPNDNSFGQDSIGFIVTDNGTPALSSTGVVSVSIAPVNDPPNALAVNLAVNQDSLFRDNAAVPLKGSDIDTADILSYSIATGADAPKMGNVNLANNGTAIVYQPNPGSTGTDTFKYIVTDNASPPASATANITVSINAAPIIVGPSVNTTVPEDGSVDIIIEASDSGSANLSLTLISALKSRLPIQDIPITKSTPVAGTTQFTFSYAPIDHFNGTDTLTFIVSDDAQPVPAKTMAELQISITPENDNPIALATPIATSPIIIPEDSTAVSFTLLATDIDLDPDLNLAGKSDTLTFTVDDYDLIPNSDNTIDTKLGKITLNPNNGKVTYTVNPDQFGMDVFPFKVMDSAPSPVISSANVTIEITPTNDRPVFNKPDGVISVFQGQANEIDLSSYVSDVDNTINDPTVFTYLLANGNTTVTTANGATVSIAANNPGIYSYLAADDYVGADSFDVEVSDGTDTSSPTTIMIDVIAATLDAPVASDFLSLETNEDKAYEGNFIAIAPKNRTILQYNITKNPTGGSVVIIDQSTGKFKYIPNPDTNGTDSFEYNAVDNTNAQSAAAKISIKINPINDPPSVDESLSDLYAEVAAADRVEVLGKITATDIDSSEIFYSVSKQPRNGNVTLTVDSNDANTVIYDYVGENRQHEGEDEFTVTVSDNDTDNVQKVDQPVTICTYIDNSVCETLTKPNLVSPPHGAVNIATTADFEWQQSSLKNNKQGDISYRVIVCDNSIFSGCDYMDVPKHIVTKANNKQASVFSIGGTSILAIGLIGGLSHRRQRKLRNILVSIVVLISACNSAVEEVKPSSVVNTQGNIVYSVSGLQPNTSYFWKVISIDESTQKTAQSVTQNFLTVP